MIYKLDSNIAIIYNTQRADYKRFYERVAIYEAGVDNSNTARHTQNSISTWPTGLHCKAARALIKKRSLVSVSTQRSC